MRQRCVAAGLFLLAALSPGRTEAGVMAPDPTSAPRPDPIFRSATLRVGFAEVLDLYSPIDTVVVGDVAVLNATVLDGNSIVLTALSPGRTNVIILGQDGSALGRLVIRVRDELPNITGVYRGAQRTLLSCDPVCRPIPAEALTATE